MKKSTVWKSAYFCGNKISEYGLKNGYVDYRTLAKSFDAVMNNYIYEELTGAGFYFEQENGYIDNSDEIAELDEKIENLEEQRDELDTPDSNIFGLEYDEAIEKIENEIAELEEQREELQREQDEMPEIFQWFIISGNGAEILEDYTDEIVLYCDALDMYLWGITHWGTAWDYVLTDIKIADGVTGED